MNRKIVLALALCGATGLMVPAFAQSRYFDAPEFGHNSGQYGPNAGYRGDYGNGSNYNEPTQRYNRYGRSETNGQGYGQDQWNNGYRGNDRYNQGERWHGQGQYDEEDQDNHYR